MIGDVIEQHQRLAKLSEFTKWGESFSNEHSMGFMSVIRLFTGTPVKAAIMRSGEVVVPPASRRSCSEQSARE